MEGTLHCKIVRSPVSRGVITTINLPDLPDNVMVFTEGDLPGKSSVIINGKPIQLLARNELSYQGEPVLLLAGPDEQELSILVSETGIVCDPVYPILSFEAYSEEQIVSRKSYLQGKPSVYSSAERVTESSYHFGAVQMPVHDPSGAYTYFEDGG